MSKEQAINKKNEKDIWQIKLKKVLTIKTYRKMKRDPIVIEPTLNASIEKVWKAITDKNQMKKWYFDLSDFNPEPGFEFQFVGGKDDKSYLHLCKITELVPGKKMQYSWRYEGYW